MELTDLVMMNTFKHIKSQGKIHGFDYIKNSDDKQ